MWQYRYHSVTYGLDHTYVWLAGSTVCLATTWTMHVGGTKCPLRCARTCYDRVTNSLEFYLSHVYDGPMDNDTAVQESIIQQDRDADEACARGEHTFTVVDMPGRGGGWRPVLVCEDCR